VTLNPLLLCALKNQLDYRGAMILQVTQKLIDIGTDRHNEITFHYLAFHRQHWVLYAEFYMSKREWRLSIYSHFRDYSWCAPGI
jgi:hypothetical protein